MEKVYVVIVTYNGAQWIKHCLDSVFNSTIPVSVIVVDNGSSDSTLEIIKEDYSQCKIIATSENLGFGRGNNLGMRTAISNGADYIYLLNQDAWVMPDTFERLMAIHKNNPEYGILSPMQLTGSGEHVDTNFMKYSIQNNCNGLLEDYILGKNKDIYETQFVMAAHWLLYVPNLKNVGLFSTAFPHYGEDNNLVHRYIFYGFKIGVCPNIYGYHDREYRKQTPKQELYLKYINFITFINNPLIKKRCIIFGTLVQSIIRIFKIKNISIKDKVSTINLMFNVIGKSEKYKSYYKRPNAFINDDIIF